MLQGELIVVGHDPIDALAADLDADGWSDLVVAVDFEKRLAVFPGSSQGLGPRADVALGFSPRAIAAGDLSGDGATDIVALRGFDPFVDVLLGDGAGGLGAPHFAVITAKAEDVAVGDLDGDGDLDLATSNGVWQSISLLTGNGLGQLSAPTLFFTPFRATSLAPADFDLDGDLDLALVSEEWSFAWLLTTPGSAGWQLSPAHPIGSPAPSVVTADLDLDGRTDIVTGSTSSTSLTALYNAPSGLAAVSIDVGVDTPRFVSSGDVDADGLPDLAATCVDSAVATVLLGQVGGGFVSSDVETIGFDARAPVLADLTGDGHVDLLTANHAQLGLSLLRGDGAGDFAAWHGAQFETGGTFGWDAALGDLDGDGALDLAIAHRLAHVGATDGDVAIMLGEGAGALEAAVLYPSTYPVERVETGDVNADGLLDLAVGHDGLGRLGVRLGLGAGAFGTMKTYGLDVSLAGFRLDALADFDSDGRLDALALSGPKVTVLLGDGVGGFPVFVNSPLSPAHEDLSVGDLNLDGALDVVAKPTGSGTIAVRLGNGAGGFVAGPPYTLPGSSSSGPIDVSDLDGDGKLDLAVFALALQPSLQIHAGDGAGGFALLSQASTDSASDLAAQDLDGDGAADVALTNSLHKTVVVFFGAPGGALGAPRMHGADLSPRTLEAGDLDANGRLDLVVVDGFVTNSATVLMNVQPLPVGLTPYSAGTPSCFARMGTAASTSPKVGTPSFLFTTTNAPPRAEGIGLVGTTFSYLGTDPFGLGVLLHVDPIASAALFSFGVKSDETGFGRALLPIPGDPALANVTVYAQSLWFEPPGYSCSASPLPLATSKGLAITIQP